MLVVNRSVWCGADDTWRGSRSSSCLRLLSWVRLRGIVATLIRMSWWTLSLSRVVSMMSGASTYLLRVTGMMAKLSRVPGLSRVMVAVPSRAGRNIAELLV